MIDGIYASRWQVIPPASGSDLGSQHSTIVSPTLILLDYAPPHIGPLPDRIPISCSSKAPNLHFTQGTVGTDGPSGVRFNR